MEIVKIGTKASQGRTHLAFVASRKVIGGTAPKYMRLCDDRESPNGSPVFHLHEVDNADCSKCRSTLKAIRETEASSQIADADAAAQ